MSRAECTQPHPASVSLEAKCRVHLLGAQDPPVFQVRRPVGPSPWFLTADHAGRRLPSTLGSLGLSDPASASHIAWDIGVAGLAEQLAERLDAFLITQTYSRLVIDCNRPPGTPESIVTRSERTPIPGNESLSPAAAQAREREIFQPYHHCLGRELDARQQTGQPTLLVALHSFTPRFMGVVRPWHVGVLYHRDARLSRLLLGLLRAEKGGWRVGDNQPYSVGDDTDYTVPVHGERRAIPHVELEIRQDLIATTAGQAVWAARLARLLGQAAAALSPISPF